MLVSQKLDHSAKRCLAVVLAAGPGLVHVLDILLVVAARSRLEVHTVVHCFGTLVIGD